MDAKSYKAMWKSVQAAFVQVAQVVREDVISKNDGFTASEVEVDIGDESSGVFFMLHRAGNNGNPDAVVSIRLIDESIASGVNIKLCVDDVAEQAEVFTHVPHNYTPECFTDDTQEVLSRLRNLPLEAAATACLSFMTATTA